MKKIALQKYRFGKLILLFILSNSLKAQMLDVHKPLFTDVPFFRTSFIRQNHVKEIKGKISTKKVSDIIRFAGNRHVYIFDTLGRLSMQYEISNLGYNKFDTTTTAYFYDKSQRLKQIRYNDAKGYYAYQYEYDSLNRIIKKSYIRVENLCSNALQFTPGKSVVISSETDKYIQLTPLRYKQITYNSYGKEYKETISTFDKYGYLLNETTKFILGGERSSISYAYNKKGLLLKKEIKDNATDKVLKYQYDDSGNILQIDVYVDGTHKTVKQYLYKPKTYLMYAELQKDIATKLITIKEYTFEFYPASQ